MKVGLLLIPIYLEAIANNVKLLPIEVSSVTSIEFWR